jgi:mRNA interferase MazF
MRRGEIYRVYQPPNDVKDYRSFVIVSRQILIDAKFTKLICAPVYASGNGLSTQVCVGQDEGLKHDSWILCDDLSSIAKSSLTQYVGSLSAKKLAELDQALIVALDLYP